MPLQAKAKVRPNSPAASSELLVSTPRCLVRTASHHCIAPVRIRNYVSLPRFTSTGNQLTA
jgi:hypothetical protein